MHAYLIIGEEKSALEKADKIAENEKAKILNNPIQKIGDVRELLQFTKLSIKDKTALLLENFDKATTESQNALLKLIEEPQKNLIFILTASSEKNILTTILSRCEVVRLKNNKKATEEQIILFNEFYEQDTANKLLSVSKITSRDDAINFVSDLIYGGHANLQNNPDSHNYLEEATKTLSRLKANGNVNLQLASFVVKLS